MTDPKLVIRSDDISWAATDSGEIVVLDLRTSTYLSLNGVGTELWAALVDGACESDLVDQLRVKYGLPVERANADVASFVSNLRSLRLLEQSETQADPQRPN